MPIRERFAAPSKSRRVRRRRTRLRRRASGRNPLAEALNAASGTIVAYGVARFMLAVAGLLEDR